MITYDSETHLISDGCISPKLVVGAAKVNTDDVRLSGPDETVVMMREALRRETIVAHHSVFDLGVLCAEDASLLPDVFRAYDEGRIKCTKIRQQLLDIATGSSKYWSKQEVDDEGRWSVYRTEYTLAALARRVLNRQVEKEGTWRLKYALLSDVPIHEWPHEARDYAATDVEVTSALYDTQSQEAVGIYGSSEIADSDRQHRATWALHLMSAWGLRTDREAVIRLHRTLEREQEEAKAKLNGSGIFRLSGSKDMAEIQKRVVIGYQSQGLEVPRTATGQVAHGHDVLVASRDPDLAVLAGAMKGDKVLSVWMRPLYSGINLPISVSYNPLVDTGRTSAARPCIQQPPRKGEVRPCFIARPGYVYCSVDYDTIELRSHAQNCLEMFGHSAMADALRSGRDLHVVLAAQLMGTSYDDALERCAAGDPVAEEWRQQSKPANYGFPGGMAAASYVEYVAGYGLVVSLELAQRIRDIWFDSWPENRDYFDHVGNITAGGFGDVVHPRSGRRRGRVRFTSACNGWFQGRTADGAKEALYRVTREAYLDAGSPLYGTRPVVFMHDEIMAEVPYDPGHPERASAAADRMAKIMVDTMQEWHPDVPTPAKPVLMKRWLKGAKPVRNEHGVLLPSRAQKTPDGRTIWVADV